MIRAKIRQMFSTFSTLCLCHLSSLFGANRAKGCVSVSVWYLSFLPKNGRLHLEGFQVEEATLLHLQAGVMFQSSQKNTYSEHWREWNEALGKNLEKCWLWDIKVPRSKKQRFLNANKNRHLALCLLFRTYATQTLIYGIANIKKSMRRRWSWDSASSGLEVPFEHTVLNVHFLSKNSPLTKTYLHIQK